MSNAQVLDLLDLAGVRQALVKLLSRKVDCAVDQRRRRRTHRAHPRPAWRWIPPSADALATLAAEDRDCGDIP